jgi:hypothetical protein
LINFGVCTKSIQIKSSTYSLLGLGHCQSGFHYHFVRAGCVLPRDYSIAQYRVHHASMCMAVSAGSRVGEIAYRYSVSELGLDLMKYSFSILYKKTTRTHDAIHLLLFTAPSMFPKPKRGMKTWQRYSAFISYHWDAFDIAHNSYNEALRANYNASFILLRSTMELLIRGAFFECLAHEQFRGRSIVLDRDGAGSRLKQFLSQVFARKPQVERDFEQSSIAIYDKIARIIDDYRFRPSNSTMLRQLAEWGVFCGIRHPEAVLSRVYGELSRDVHAHPDRTDIGRILTHSSRQLFGPKKVSRRFLSEYLDDLKEVMDIGILTTCNLLQDNLIQYPGTREPLSQIASEAEALGLVYAPRRITQLLREQRAT